MVQQHGKPEGQHNHHEPVARRCLQSWCQRIAETRLLSTQDFINDTIVIGFVLKTVCKCKITAHAVAKQI